MIIRNPLRITQKHFELQLKTKDILKIKRADCSGYSACVGKAEKASWQQFSCEGCNAFTAMTAEEKALNYIRLTVLRCAIDNPEMYEAYRGGNASAIGPQHSRRGPK